MITAPAANAATITPDDDTDLAYTTRAIWVGGEGDLTVIMHGGATVTYTSVAAGTLLPIRVVRVLESTTATDLVGMW